MVYYGLGMVVVLGGILWRLSARLSRIDDDIRTIKTNDLVHLDEKIDKLAASLEDLKKTFIDIWRSRNN